MVTGTASAWDVKQYLQAEIRKMRDAGKNWPAVQRTLGKYAWNTWLMVERVTNPAPEPSPENPDDARAAVVTRAEMEVTD